jgi:beta-galactosidase/beta-glucuronidase
MSRREFLRQVAAGAAAAAAAESGLNWAEGMPPHPATPQNGSAVPLPSGVKAVWDLSKAYREATPTRARICVNGLWRWQPAKGSADQVPSGNWGYFKVPGSWPGISDYMQVECQTVYPNPRWQNEKIEETTGAWYQRELTIPSDWTGRRITLYAEYVNSYAIVFIDGRKVGEIRFPAGEVDLTPVCQPGNTHVLSLYVLAMPLKGVMMSYSDTSSAKEAKGSVQRRGLCGDVYLVSTPAAARITDVKVDTSVRKGEITVEAGFQGLAADKTYSLRAEITEQGRRVHTMTSAPFRGGDLKECRTTFTDKWVAGKLWDLHTPQHQYELSLTLLDAASKVVDTALPVRFGYREFWIDGKDFYLNGTRIFLSSIPIDNAQVGATAASYEGAKETLERFRSFGINFVYTHNYGCEPGTHLSFEEILRAADDVGMLLVLSQPHFGQYDWKAEDADKSNGYARHAGFYVRVARNHPSVVAYAMSHNATGYTEDANPDMIDGLTDPRDQWSLRNSKLAVRAEAIVKAMDPGRIVYHHSSGNLSSMHTINFYPNWAPIQELSDWFEHWATKGVKPVFTCEYAAPCTWDWTMYRGWYKGKRTFGSATVPWEFCVAEWDAQFLGDRAYRMSEREKRNLRWEAKQFREGKLWHRWDYPTDIGSSAFEDRHTVTARYVTDNWRAFRTWGMSANSPWEYDPFWTLRENVDRSRKEFRVDWERLQRPGFSPDYLERPFEAMPQSFARTDWIPNADGQALLRNNMPLLAYIAGKPSRFTSKDHNFLPGENIDKQLIIINNSRETVTCEWEWSANLPQPQSGRGRVGVPTGEQARVGISFTVPSAGGTYELTATARFSTGEVQTDSFVIHVLPRPAALRASARIALFDPKGETGKLLTDMSVRFQSVAATADLSRYDLLVIGKGALTIDQPGPDLSRVREGLKVIVFEQTSEALEKRLGFRVMEYGLRQVFPRVPGHPLLAGVGEEHLRDWRGEATLLPPRLKYETNDEVFNGAPTVKWCDIPVTRVWRCGNRGNIASVLIEKPTRGDFMPILDGGYALQYSPLMEYREGKGMVLFCQVDVTGRSESDPAAEALTRNLVQHAASWKPTPRRAALYVGDPAGRKCLAAAGVAVGSYGGGELTADQVLIVGPGGGSQLSRSARPIASWLRAGGSLLAIGLDEAGANAFLPFHVSMKGEEHIAAAFAPAGVGSPLTGVSCADTMNRDPRELPLVTGGASVVGNGVLALGENARVVFCQLAPWEFDWRQPLRRADAPPLMNLKRTYRRTSVLLARLLGNLGVGGATPVLSRFSQPVAPGDKRWLEGMYLDQPEEWDDPYRYFGW